MDEFKALLVDQFPFVCSIAALFAGVLIGRMFALRVANAVAWIGAIICLLCVFVFKNHAALLLANGMMAIGIAEYVSLTLGGVVVTFIGGVALAFVLLDAGKESASAG